MSINKKGQAATQKPKGLDLSGLPDFSGGTPPVTPAAKPTDKPADKPADKAAPAGAANLNSFMGPSAAPAATGGGANLNAFMGPQASHSGSGAVHANPGVAAIREMQKAILNFATKAEDTSATSLQGKGKEEGEQVSETPNPQFDPSKPESPENPRKIKSNNYLGGTDPFGNFLVKTYLGDNDGVGKQYLNVDVAGLANREKASIEDTSLKGIIDTIKRIGTPGTIGTEKATDGVWKVRTNNALKNIYAVAYAMFHAASDMDLSLPGLTDAKLEEFKNLVPINYTDIKDSEKGDQAKKLTPLINDMALVFDSFKKFVLKNKKYTKYIEQQKSFVSYKQQPQNGNTLLNDEEKALFKDHSTKPIPGVKVGNAEVSLFDLENLNNFKNMMERAGRKSNDPNEVARTVAEVSKVLGGQMPTIKNDPGY